METFPKYRAGPMVLVKQDANLLPRLKCSGFRVIAKVIFKIEPALWRPFGECAFDK
jgi:hypothetical protein